MTTEQTQAEPETRPSEVRSDALLGDWWVVWLMLGDEPMPMAAFSTQDLAAEWMNSRNSAVAPACYVTHGWKSPNAESEALT